MTMVNMLEAKSTLSRLVEAVEAGGAEVIIARNGKPAARLVAITKPAPTVRIGVAKGVCLTPAPDAEMEATAAAVFLGQSACGR
jgi:prevent-host-death family protein